MARATGIGGVFLRSRDPKALYAWYEKHLGLPMAHGSFSFPAENERAVIAFAFFSEKDAYFPPSQPVMLNFQVDPKRDSADYGKFGWFTDPEGNRVELWQPADEKH